MELKLFQKRWLGILGFLIAYVFFQFFYPYHLIRREQLSIFLYDWDYIFQTYRGAGWLARFGSDFLEQFFGLPIVGPVVIAALVTAIGLTAYKISRHFLGKCPSLAIAVLFYIWSFLRETENVYCTRYTLVVLGFLALVLAALSLPKTWMKLTATMAFLALGAWALGAPFDQEHGRVVGFPMLKMDKVIGLDTEVYREHWDKALSLSISDARLTEESYCYNLAHAMKGDLPLALFSHPQNFAKSLLFWSSSSPFQVGVVGEAWYHLGDMTLAEQCAIISLLSMPNHIGSRPVMRLARCNMATGDEGAAQKYLDLLSKTLFYGKWARRVLAGNPDQDTARWLKQAQARLATSDIVYDMNEFRPILLGLLEADPSNTLARDYLLCYDLLRFNLDEFVVDFTREGMPEAPIYKQAILIWLIQRKELTDQNMARYNIEKTYADQMQRFLRYPDSHKDTYWYFYFNAIQD